MSLSCFWRHHDSILSDLISMHSLKIVIILLSVSQDASWCDKLADILINLNIPYHFLSTKLLLCCERLCVSLCARETTFVRCCLAATIQSTKHYYRCIYTTIHRVIRGQDVIMLSSHDRFVLSSDYESKLTESVEYSI